MLSLLDNPQAWRKRAEEMRELAGKEDDPAIKQKLEELAAAYEELAERAAENSQLRRSRRLIR